MPYTPIPPGSLNWDVPVNAQFTTDNSRLDTIDSNITFLTSVITGLSGQIAALQNNDPGPPDQALDAWSYDPVMATGTVTLTAGQMLMCKIPIVASISTIFCYYQVATAGSGLTAAQNFLALYDSTGSRVAVSTDQTVNMGTIGTKVAGVSANLNAGFYWLAVLSNGTTPPILRGVTTTAGAVNTGVSGNMGRFVTQGAALTATPASFTPASNVLTDRALWVGLT